MPQYSNDGMIRVQFAPSVANIALPLVTEANAGTHITPFLTKDGLTTPADQNNVDVGTLAETFDAQTVGTFGGALEMTGIRNNTADTLWNLIVYGLTGFIIVRRGVPTASAFAASQKVEVFPVVFHEPIPAQTGGNESSRFAVSAPVTSQPNLKATMA
jgi:hypothetical protein